MPEEQEYIFEVADGVGTLTFNRPDKRNALTTGMYDGIADVCNSVRSDDNVKVLIITGNGSAFCSGSDIEKRMLPRMKTGYYIPVEETRAELIAPPMVRVAPALYNLGKPTIAAVNGIAAGAGLSVAMLCDFRIVSDKSKYLAAWANIGLAPDIGATFTLPRLVGVDRALKMILTRETIDAAEAERIRLVTQVVPHEQLMKTVRDFAVMIAGGTSVAYELARQALHHGIINDLEAQLTFEAYAQGVCFNSEDFREGVKAFLEKRKPAYKGK